MNYSTFGAPLPGRGFTSSTPYRYNFNGKEEDPETVGTAGGTQDYGERIYYPSLGRFLSVDPLTKKYPWWTPYQFAGNMPIRAIDIDGLEPPTEDLNELDKEPLEETSEDMGLKPSEEKYEPRTDEERLEDLKTMEKLGRNNGNKTEPMFETLPGGYIVQIPPKLTNTNSEEIEKEQEDKNESKNKNPYSNQSKEELLKSRSSFEKLIKEHKQKLEDYVKDPMKYDNKDLLKNAPTRDVFNKIIVGRVKELFNQIKKQEGELEKVNGELKKFEKVNEKKPVSGSF